MPSPVNSPPPHEILTDRWDDCPEGHSMEPGNVWVQNGNRHCKLCNLESAKRCRERRHGELIPYLPKGPRCREG